MRILMIILIVFSCFGCATGMHHQHRKYFKDWNDRTTCQTTTSVVGSYMYSDTTCN